MTSTPQTLILTAAKRDHIAALCAILAIEAGKLIMEVRRIGPCSRAKLDNSPVCEADDRAEGSIIAGLRAAFPDVTIIAEESYAAGDRPQNVSRFFLIDALDGTAAFLAGEDGFTVNIALVDKGLPIVGVVYAPATGQLWLAGKTAFGCQVADCNMPPRESWKPLHTRATPSVGPTALVSMRYLEQRSVAFVEKLEVSNRQQSSSSIKFCQIAAGEADLYPRFGPTMIWDSAAGHAILKSAGGDILDENGALLTYNLPRPTMFNPGFVAFGDQALVPRLREALNSSAS